MRLATSGLAQSSACYFVRFRGEAGHALWCGFDRLGRGWHESDEPITAGYVRSWGVKRSCRLRARNDANEPGAVIGQIAIPRRGRLLPDLHGVLSFWVGPGQRATRFRTFQVWPKDFSAA
jgi:hypothetical protein